MINVIVFDGGLGNQMFQYAFYISLKNKKKFDFFCFDKSECAFHHQGFQISDIFRLSCSKQIFQYRLLKRIWKSWRKHAKLICQTSPRSYNSSIFNNLSHINLYCGYWQSEYFFSHVKDHVLQSFKFREKKLNYKTRQLSKFLENNKTVSVHIRRGDYLNNSRWNVCSKEYYTTAIEYIKTQVDGVICVFFSDDIEWVKQHLFINGAVYVDWNKDYDNWQDLYLMSKCKNNIIANSTFSWWGAWLNKNYEKIVVAPQHWIVGETESDIIPSSWIRI